MPVDIALGEPDVAPVDEAAQPRTSADLEGRVRAARALAAERVHASVRHAQGQAPYADSIGHG